MADIWKHGALGEIQLAGTRVAAGSRNAIVYVGTAPVHMVEGGAANVNVPILVNNIAEARKYFGYSDNFADYTLCEAMRAHLELGGVGPLVFINVLDPTKHKKAEQGTTSLVPENGRIIIQNAGSIVLDSVSVTKSDGEEPLVKNKDYAITYNISKQAITISALSADALGKEAATIKYDEIDPEKVKEADVIGATDGLGMNTGLYAINNVYQLTGYIPSFLLAPGFAELPEVHTVMCQVSQKVNGHWDVYMLVDIPIVDKEMSGVTLLTAATWKKANGYTRENESVYFPLAQGTDGYIYHISTLAAANLQALLVANSGIPYMTPSNTDCPIVQNLYLGEEAKGRVYDDSIINERLNRNGINSAAYVGGRWVIWGCFSADYNADEANEVNISETNCMMLYYLSNDFQHRRARDVDKPLTANDLKSIVSEEQAKLDALIKIGALVLGRVEIDASAIARSDVYRGDYRFSFVVTTTPLAKSLTAYVYWTTEGYVTYFDSFEAAA